MSVSSTTARLDLLQRASGPMAAHLATCERTLRAPTAAEKKQILELVDAIHKAWNDFASTPAVRAANVMALMHPDYNTWTGSLGRAGVYPNAAAVERYYVGVMSGPVGKAVYNTIPFDIRVTQDGSMAIVHEESTLKGPGVDLKLFANTVLVKGSNGKLLPISTFNMYVPPPTPGK